VLVLKGPSIYYKVSHCVIDGYKGDLRSIKRGIIEAALSASIMTAKEKGGDRSTTTAARALVKGVGADCFIIGSFVYMLYSVDKE
jgi:hypothetical protein